MTDDTEVQTTADVEVQEPPKDDPLLALLEGMQKDNQEIIINTIQQQQGKITELQQQIEAITKSSVDDKKKAILDNLTAAGLDVKDYDKYTLEQLEAIAHALSQNNDKIVITTKKEDPNKPDFQSYVMVKGKKSHFFKAAEPDK